MKKKLLLILALTLVVVTVVAGLAGCKSANAKQVAKYIKAQEPTTITTTDVSATLTGYVFADGLQYARSFVLNNGTDYYIAYVNDDGSLTAPVLVGSMATITINAVDVNYTQGQGISYWAVTNTPASGPITYTIYDAKGTVIMSGENDTLFETVKTNDAMYLFNADPDEGNIYVIDLETGVATALLDADGLAINVKYANIAALDGATKTGEYYYQGNNGAIVVYDKYANLVDNIVFPTIFDNMATVQLCYLVNGNILVQGENRVPDDASDYDIVKNGYKYELITVLYDIEDGSWSEPKGYGDIQIVDVYAVEEDDATFTNCDNVISFYNITNYKVDTSVTYTATLDNNGKIGATFLEDEKMAISDFAMFEDYLGVIVEDAIGTQYIKVYNGKKLINTVNAYVIAEYNIAGVYYLDNAGFIKSYVDTEFAVDTKAGNYEYSNGLFTVTTGSEVAYYIFNTDTQAIEALTINTNSGYKVASVYRTEEYLTVRYNGIADPSNTQMGIQKIDGTVVLAAADYDYANGVYYTVDNTGKIATAYTIVSNK